MMPADRPLKRPLKLGLIEGNEEGWTKSLGNKDDELECPVEGSDDGPEEEALLKLEACRKGTKRAVPKL